MYQNGTPFQKVTSSTGTYFPPTRQVPSGQMAFFHYPEQNPRPDTRLSLSSTNNHLLSKGYCQRVNGITFQCREETGNEVSGSVSGEARIRVIRGKPTTHNPQNTRKPLRGTLKTLNFKVPVHTFRVFCDGRRPFCVFCGQSPPIKGTGTTDGTDTHFARHRCTRLCERSALCGPHDLITRR